ncbi:MAG: sensor histidine kinase, partial [Chitinophagaceae bacterium]
YLPDSEEVGFLLQKEIEEYNVFTSFKFGIYNASEKRFNYIRYIPTDQLEPDPGKELPLLEKSYNYIGILFPNREKFIIREMGFWIFSTIILLLVLTGFAISIYKLFRQKQLSEIQKDFINNMTHEFRTPIATIQLSTEVLKNNNSIQTNKRLFQYASIIENEANHLEGQVERVLQVAKMENHTLHLEKQPVDVHQIISQTIHDFENTIQQKEGHFVLNLQAERPVIMADKLHFTNIIFNLTDNAIKYSSKPVVTFETCNEKTGISIFIKDNGQGIPEKYRKFLFTKFFRVPTGNLHEVKGFGLGLNYVKLYTNYLNGTVHLESELGKGSNFILYFPDASSPA